MSVFDGMDPSGVWTISVSDVVGQDLGTLNSWCVTTTTDATVANVPCFTDLTNSNGLLTVESGISDYESDNFITTTSATLIEPNATVDYDAANSIQLNPPFEVELGATFEAFIDGCNNGAGGSNNVNEESTEEKKK